MRRPRLFAVLVLVVATSSRGMAQAPQPGPEVKKLAVMAGVWQYEGEAKATALGPAAKISGKQTGTMVANGFGLQWSGQETGAFGGVQWGEIDVYDAASKTYRFLGYQSDGATWSGTFTIAGNTWKATSTMTVKGTSYHMRAETVIAADGKSQTWKAELSTDGGKTWVPWVEQKLTKVS
ncbi:MAG TPA: hypothetical protein VLT86_19675 [Vicinamibacterales bacterium]|nr:hypothetical protein [Vicinamibacterales bacterium]